MDALQAAEAAQSYPAVALVVVVTSFIHWLLSRADKREARAEAEIPVVRHLPSHARLRTAPPVVEDDQGRHAADAA